MTTGHNDSEDARDEAPGSAFRQWRIALLGTGLLVCAVLVALSPSFGRARPSGAYRPLLPPDALSNGCYPLPSGVKLAFDYQVRRDGDVTIPGEGRRRRLQLQYDLIDVDAAAAALTASFAKAGFHPDAPSGTTGADRSVTLSKGPVRVSAVLTPMSPLRPGQIVRGSIVLDLPVAKRASDAPVCSDTASTKRFTAEPTTWS